MTKLTIKIGPLATALIAGGLILGGWCWGVHDRKKYYEDRIAKKDAFEQFLDLVSDALDEDGQVFYG